MPYLQSDGAKLYYEEAGSGTPIIFVHEFSGDLWSWEKQIQYFSRRYRCIAFNARGYPPSEVPARLSNYSHKHAVDAASEDTPRAHHGLLDGFAHDAGFWADVSAHGDFAHDDRHRQRRRSAQ
jgi:pimeloyl-ACP methyl ester carboxylesterase